MLKFLQIRYLFSLIWKFIFSICYKITFKNFWVSYVLYFILFYGLVWGFSFYFIYYFYTDFTNLFIANNFRVNSLSYIHGPFSYNNNLLELSIKQFNSILIGFWNLYFKLLLEFNVIFFNIFLYSFVSLIFLHCFFSLNHVFKDYIRNINNSLYIFYFYIFIYLIFRLCLFVTSCYNLWFLDFNSLIIGSFFFLIFFSIFHYNKIILINFFNYWIVSLLIVAVIIGGQFINSFFSKFVIWCLFLNNEYYYIRLSFKPISIISDMLSSLYMLIETFYIFILLEIKLIFFDLLLNIFNILYLY